MTESSCRAMAAPCISIIVPTYNVRKYFVKAIQSLRSQTLKDIEIILVDDGSTDGTYEMCLRQQAEDPRIRVMRMEQNGGVSAARNLGLSVARGAFISFVDADDWVEEDMMEYLLQLIMENNADISTCEFCKEYLDGKSEIHGSHKSYPADYMHVVNAINYGKEFTPYLVDKLYKRELLKGLYFQTGISIGEDYRFLMEVMLRNPVVMRGGECKYHYQQLNGSATHKGFESIEGTRRNIAGYQSAFELLCNEDERFRKSALAYYMLQEMAVITSMVKSGKYNDILMKNVQSEIRKYLKEYLTLTRVPAYLKICALFLSIHEKLLILPYRLLAHLVK